MLPLGSGALAGSGFPFDREAIARDLGFDSITRNSMDVSGDRDFALDFLYAASVTMIHLSRLAEDWILYSGEEFGWMELGDGVTSGSSLMPQKKNPDSLELIRGKCGRVMGCLTSLMVTMKGLPMTYNRDMQEDKVPLFEAADELAGCARNGARGHRIGEAQPGQTRRGGGRELGGGDRSRRGAGARRDAVPSGASNCRTVRARKRAQGKKPSDWTPEEMRAFAPEFTADFARLLDPRPGMHIARTARRHRSASGSGGAGRGPRTPSQHGL